MNNGSAMFYDENPFSPPGSPTRVNGNGVVSNLRFPFLIGVAGGTASGKTSVCHQIMKQLELSDSSQKRVVVLSQDSFYKKLELKDKRLASVGEYNFDHPGKCSREIMSPSLPLGVLSPNSHMLSMCLPRCI